LVSSQGPFDPATGQLVGHDAESQARQVFANIGSICDAAGASLANVVRVRLFLADLNDLDAVNAIYQGAFGNPLPARTAIQVGLPGILVAAEATAMIEGVG
jgi:2-iminobutanoate/2-iminopropanoate deaminase